MWDSQGTDPQIVLKKRYAVLTGWILFLTAILLLLISLFKFASGKDEIAGALLVFVPIFALLGIYLASSATTVTFHRYTDSMTVTRGHIPRFLFWWKRTKEFSRETAITATVTVVAGDGETETVYRVEVMTPEGQPFILFMDKNSRTAEDLAIKIRQWGGLEV